MISNQTNKNSKNDKLNQWLELTKSDGDKLPISKRSSEGPIPLSFGQLRLWFLQQLNPGNPFYHYAESYQLTGPLDEELFLDCFRKLVKRHDILRTTFPQSEGSPVQKINSELEPFIQSIDLRTLEKHLVNTVVEDTFRAVANKPFDLESGPFTRLLLFRIDDEEYQMMVAMHHIVTDKWSMELLREEWAALYRGETLPKQEIQYSEFAYQQRNRSVDQQHLQYWLDQLGGEIPNLELPMAKNSSSSPSYRGAHNLKQLSQSQSQGLKKLCRETGSTMFVLMLSIFKALLFRYTRETDLLVATPVSNRNQVNLEKLIGFFNETLVIRDTVTGDTGFIQLVKQVQSTVWDGFAHQAIPFESIVKELKPERLISGNPLFQVMFLYHQVPEMPSLEQDIQWTIQPFDTRVAKFDLTLYISEDKQQLTTVFEYATDVFEQTTIEMMQDHFSTLVDGILKNPKARLDDLPLLTESETELILNQWNRSDQPMTESETVADLIEKNIREYPQRTAVVFNGKSTTYQELGDRATAVAQCIQAMPAEYEKPLGVFTERSVDMIVGILAALKLGRTYIPLDPEYPWSRIEMILHDSRINQVIVQDHLQHQFADYDIITISSDQRTQTVGTAVNIGDKHNSLPAYIIYTSGSTGKPKGVPVSKQNLLHSTRARMSYYPDQPGKFLLMSSFSFDSSVAGIFWTLCGGGTMVLPEEKLEQDIEALGSLIEKQQITHTLLLPSLYHLLLQHSKSENLESLQTVIVAGEACQSEVVVTHFETLPNTKIYNEYGPTEATVWSTVHQLQPSDSDTNIPIGKPIANTQIFILDQNQSLVPVGVTGEIYIGGTGVVSGYLNQPELNTKFFVENPFDQESKTKLYKTGDLGRYRFDGTIEFLGRADQQIKIRGYRVEPGEILHKINSYPGISGSELIVHSSGSPGQIKKLDGEDVNELIEKLQELDPDKAEKLLRSVENLEQFNFQTTND